MPTVPSTLRAAQWSRNNADVLAQMPALRTEFNGYVQSARRGQQLSTDARSGLDQARAAHQMSELEVDRSIVGTLLREDPRDVASKLLGGGYNAEKRLDEIAALVKNDAPAARGWKAAVAEVLADKVQGSRMVGEAPEVQFARLAKEFKDNEVLLAKTFSPEDMNGLRQAHKLLEYFKEAEKRATVGRNTADKWNVPGWAQLAVRHFKGDLAGGGLIKRFKLLLEQLPSNKRRLNVRFLGACAPCRGDDGSATRWSKGLRRPPSTSTSGYALHEPSGCETCRKRRVRDLRTRFARCVR